MAGRVNPKLIGGLCAAAIVAAGASIYVTSRQDNSPAQESYQEGLKALSASRVDEAQAAFQSSIKADPKFGPSYVQLGVIYASRRQFMEAGDAYSHAAKLMPDDGKIWFVLSTIDVSLRNFPSAEAAAQRAAQLLPSDADVQGQLADVENKMGHADMAYDAYRKAHTLQPDKPEYLITLARFGLVTPHESDQLPYQEQELAKYLSTHPGDVDAAKVMAETEERLPPTPDRLATGIKYALVAQAAFPKDADIATDLGQLYLSANQPADALKAYEKANELKPHSEPIMHGMVVCYLKTGQADKASAMSKRIQQLPAKK